MNTTYRGFSPNWRHTVDCPKCVAKAGEPCLTATGYITQQHAARIALAREARAQ